ncbi:DUF4178 domain-containing protein [Nocardioides sp. NPDC057772]|uniref:DUF4178 domain-containing protein n=1 Tax=Nocardioides sp. NPDC057772 TaxID=3346245 RepID=UPI0036718FAC
MIYVLIVLLLAALAVAAYLLWRSRQQPTAPQEPDDFIGDQHKHASDQLRQVRNGDVIEYLGHNWFVRGRIDFDEHGYRWTEHMLDDAEGKKWLSIEDDESFEVSLWHSIPLGDIEQGTVGDRDVIVGGVAYRLQEKGSAAFTATGATGTAPSGTAEYADYKSVDGKLLGFEKWGNNWEPSLGEVLQPFELTVYPSSDRPATLGDE